MTSIYLNNSLLLSFSTRVFLFIVVIGILPACVQDGEQAKEQAEALDPLVGAWGGKTVFGDQPVDVVVIFTPAHQVAAWYDASSGALVSSNGGLWSRTGNHVTETVEFHSDRPERVGTDVSFDIALNDDSLSIVGSNSWLTRIDRSDQNTLEGGWELVEPDQKSSSTISSSGTKHVRMMSSSRFQEIEYEPESGLIVSIAGGSYRIDEKGYNETILFGTEAVNFTSTHISVEQEGDSWSQGDAGQIERIWLRR